MKPVRLHKFLADAGIASRRKAEEMITNGRVRVNDKVVRTLGVTIDPAIDRVSVGGRPIKAPSSREVIVVYKPNGIISTTKVGREKGKPVTELVRSKSRLFIAGRLDQDAEGLLILTNDGDLAERISHPRYEHEKEYVVKTQEQVEPTRLRMFERGVRVGNERWRAKRAWRSGSHEFHIVLTTGHKHQIRRMADAARMTIHALKRVRIGQLTLAGLQPGGSRVLTAAEIDLLTTPIGVRKRRS